MSYLHSLLLGIVQGITEFLPVSSSGHLIVMRHICGIKEHFRNIFFAGQTLDVR